MKKKVDKEKGEFETFGDINIAVTLFSCKTMHEHTTGGVWLYCDGNFGTPARATILEWKHLLEPDK